MPPLAQVASSHPSTKKTTRRHRSRHHRQTQRWQITLLNRMVAKNAPSVSPIPGTHHGQRGHGNHADGRDYRFVDTAGFAAKAKTTLVAKNAAWLWPAAAWSAAMSLSLVVDGEQGVTQGDAQIAATRRVRPLRRHRHQQMGFSPSSRARDAASRDAATAKG